MNMREKNCDKSFDHTDDESSEDGDAEGTVGLGDTMADRQMPPHNAEPRSGKHQERVTNIIDLYSSTDTSSTVSPSISRKKWDVRKKTHRDGDILHK